jgi:hypothetical protein
MLGGSVHGVKGEKLNELLFFLSWKDFLND